MDEPLQTKLAKANINITDITEEHILFEFPYHPRPGEVKWCKSFAVREQYLDDYGRKREHAPIYQTATKIPDLVLEMRKALEK